MRRSDPSFDTTVHGPPRPALLFVARTLSCQWDPVGPLGGAKEREIQAGPVLARKKPGQPRTDYCNNLKQQSLLFVCLLTAPYHAPHLVHKMLVLKDISVFRFFGVLLYGWILQSDLMLPCYLEWLLAGMEMVPIRCLAAFDSVPGFFHYQRSTDTSK